MTLKPSISAEQQILAGIQSGKYPVGSNLPPERELALDLQVTRPTLREVLQRLARDGWLDIHHGRPTKVQNYLEDGNLTVLSTLAEKMDEIPSRTDRSGPASTAVAGSCLHPAR